MSLSSAPRGHEVKRRAAQPSVWPPLPSVHVRLARYELLHRSSRRDTSCAGRWTVCVCLPAVGAYLRVDGHVSPRKATGQLNENACEQVHDTVRATGRRESMQLFLFLPSSPPSPTSRPLLRRCPPAGARCRAPRRDPLSLPPPPCTRATPVRVSLRGSALCDRALGDCDLRSITGPCQAHRCTG